LVIPASVTKLYTCATALNEFGPDHRFVTPVVRRGEVKDKVLDGDLILVASGDLTFGGRQGPDGKTLFQDSDHTYANGGSSGSKGPGRTSSSSEGGSRRRQPRRSASTRSRTRRRGPGLCSSRPSGGTVSASMRARSSPGGPTCRRRTQS